MIVHTRIRTAELARIRAVLTVRSSTEIAAAHLNGVLRARLLPGGTAIIAALREATGADEFVLTAAGLRDGILIEFFETRCAKGATCRQKPLRGFSPSEHHSHG
jgi:exopolyphosphatase/pppGpp-phosphohydrolase